MHANPGVPGTERTPLHTNSVTVFRRYFLTRTWKYCFLLGRSPRDLFLNNAYRIGISILSMCGAFNKIVLVVRQFPNRNCNSIKQNVLLLLLLNVTRNYRQLFYINKYFRIWHFTVIVFKYI